MTGTPRHERRRIFDEENFDTEDRLDRALAGVFLFLAAVLAFALARLLFF